ncbi:hypothetical protein G7047_14625 [Diaphorobacter sp. HDW4A]|uniref:hypothetical protein n=1 Tax=Diaphorobacter sp. HDW4A TaxID=2714924 RepID=UPI00140A8C1E|nr:hypothetical protein [Diaphorobacter sp. HDW4A]QIL80992.1 hypothetical protein G7047_14625 [Diaphorobacter sp. HDW4A]
MSAAESPQQPKTSPNWEAIERDFRTGVRAVNAIAKEHGITEGAIRKRAKRDGWVRDLNAKVRAKADELVRKSVVRAQVREDQRLTEARQIEVEANLMKETRLGQRADVKRARRLVAKLLAELELQTEQVPELLRLGEILRQDDDKAPDRLNDIYQAVISFPERTKSMKALAEAMRILVSLESEVCGLNAHPDAGTEGDKDFLERLLDARTRAANR